MERTVSVFRPGTVRSFQYKPFVVNRERQEGMTKQLIWVPRPVPSMLLMRSPMMKCYQAERHDGHLSVFVGKENGQWHLSISHRRGTQPGRYPTWDEIKDARYRFCPDEMTMAMLLPPRAEFVNLHDTTFHLWEMP